MNSQSKGYDEYSNNKKVKWDLQMVKGCLIWMGILVLILIFSGVGFLVNYLIER